MYLHLNSVRQNIPQISQQFKPNCPLDNNVYTIQPTSVPAILSVNYPTAGLTHALITPHPTPALPPVIEMDFFLRFDTN